MDDFLIKFLTTYLKNIDYTVPLFCIKAMAFITGFFLVATIFANFYAALYSFIFSKKYGYKTKFLILFGLVFTKIDNKWKKIYYKQTPLCGAIPTIDGDNIHKDFSEREKQLSYSERFSKLFLSIIIFALTLKPIIGLFKGESISLVNLFLIGFSTGMIFHSINHIGISIYIFEKLYKGLMGYINSKTQLLIDGENIENLDLKPIEELPYKSPSPMEKMYYYLFYSSYLFSLNKTEEMKKVSQEMSDLLGNKNTNIVNYLCNYLAYYWLLFYYSEIETDKEKADDYFKKIEPIICNDEDSNAKRILAYYYYRIYNDSEKAKNLLEEGLARIDKFSFGPDRALENKLLLKLKNEIETKRLIS